MDANEIEAWRHHMEHLCIQAGRAAEGWNDAWYRHTEEDDLEARPPTDERQVLVFLNGHVGLTDMEGRKGGGHGVRMGFYDHDRNMWRVGGQLDNHVTHWREIPGQPNTNPFTPHTTYEP